MPTTSLHFNQLIKQTDKTFRTVDEMLKHYNVSEKIYKTRHKNDAKA